MGVFDSLNEAYGCTDYNAKSLNSLQCTVDKKNEEKPQKIHFFQTLRFLVVFIDLFSNGTVFRVGFFWRFTQCIQTVHLSYGPPTYDDFHFLGCNVFFFNNFSDPSYQG